MIALGSRIHERGIPGAEIDEALVGREFKMHVIADKQCQGQDESGFEFHVPDTLVRLRAHGHRRRQQGRERTHRQGSTQGETHDTPPRPSLPPSPTSGITAPPRSSAETTSPVAAFTATMKPSSGESPPAMPVTTISPTTSGAD